nr:orotidine-5'-phosphate decarboxylase [Candidatus Woesearchaeota archaeon]
MHLKSRLKLSYKERSDLTKNSAAKKLLNLMEDKKTNLAVGCDLTKKEEVLKLVKKLKDEIVILKTHIDIIEDFDKDLTNELKQLAKDYNFMIFEDRKLADIGNTSQIQYTKGIYKIIDWADFVNCHVISGEDIIKSLNIAAKDKIKNNIPRGLILLAQMSSKGTLATGDYTKNVVEMAKRNKDFVVGFIGNGSNPEELEELANLAEPEFIIFTPGIRIDSSSDSLGQLYSTPALAINSGSDIVITGRGIYQSNDPYKLAKLYRKQGWEAYKNRKK